MKKILLSLIVLVFGVMLAGCWPKMEETKTVDEAALGLSEDDSLETIEKELEETTIEDYEAELDKLDKEIDQL